MVDEIAELDWGKTAVGKFYVKPELPVFRGHFPGDPTFPGIYTIEASSQVGAILVNTLDQYKGKVGLLLGVNRASFYKKIRPGDMFETHSRIAHIREDKAIVTIENEVYVDGELAAVTEMAVAMR
jgi:3-hydroxyacyl-[acyl-carrier-protein] dehydratase